jgi:endonuclease/exonuclease/phosphatase (EEP) superfamily protein YafD
MRSVVRDSISRFASGLSIAALCSCVTLTTEPRAIVSETGSGGRVTTLMCDAAARSLQSAVADEAANALNGRAFRVLVWNIHKQDDPGWQRDLTLFTTTNDIMLLQETALQPSLRSILDDAGLRWVMASSFLYDASDMGVLTASRIPPVASCTQRMLEPLLRIPKSAVIAWLRVTGVQETLAVVNIHAINFDLFIDAYRTQLQALADALAGHQGPIVFAGDFNTWSDARDAVVAETAARLGMTEVAFRDDQRSVFIGRRFDHVFVRGLEVLEVAAIPVTSSDHNPLVMTLRAGPSSATVARPAALAVPAKSASEWDGRLKSSPAPVTRCERATSAIEYGL